MKLLQIVFIGFVCILGAIAHSDEVKYRKRYTRYQGPAKRNTVDTAKILNRRISAISTHVDYLLSNCLGHKDENILFAPINIIKTLSTIMLGAGGKTERELSRFIGTLLGSQVLGKRSKAVLEFHQMMGKLLTQVIRDSPGVSSTSLDIAGGIFVQSDYQVKKSYVDNAKNIYHSEVYNLNFVTDGYKAANFINDWVSSKTHGRMKNLLSPPIDPMTRIIVAGVLYFNGDWEVPFPLQNTVWRPFYLGSDGKFGKESVLVEMMINQAEVLYYESENMGFQTLGIPYKNKEVYMFVILPQLNVTLKSLTCRLTRVDILDIVENKAVPTEAFYVLPKMNLDSQISLRPVLEHFNVSSMFDPATADFSNMANDGVFATDIIHRVDMDINEIGTTAAAATSTFISRGGHLTFRADRPFLFFIYNRKAGIMTFWGSIRKPTPNRPNDGDY